MSRSEYNVTVMRTEKENRIFRVVAEDSAAAEIAALEEARKFDWDGDSWTNISMIEMLGEPVLIKRAGRKFTVKMQRTEYRTTEFEVEADSREEAESKAVRCSYDYDWHDTPVKDAGEEVVSIIEEEK